jgi:hypothetical protein
VISSSNIIKNPQVLKRRRREKRKKEKKAPKSPQIKGEANILRGEKHLNAKIPF